MAVVPFGDLGGHDDSFLIFQMNEDSTYSAHNLAIVVLGKPFDEDSRCQGQLKKLGRSRLD